MSNTNHHHHKPVGVPPHYGQGGSAPQHHYAMPNPAGTEHQATAGGAYPPHYGAGFPPHHAAAAGYPHHHYAGARHQAAAAAAHLAHQQHDSETAKALLSGKEPSCFLDRCFIDKNVSF